MKHSEGRCWGGPWVLRAVVAPAMQPCITRPTPNRRSLGDCQRVGHYTHPDLAVDTNTTPTNTCLTPLLLFLPKNPGQLDTKPYTAANIKPTQTPTATYLECSHQQHQFHALLYRLV